MKPITIHKGEKFYAASGPYRSIRSRPDCIFAECDSFDEAVDLAYRNSIAEDGKSIFIKRDGYWIEVDRCDPRYSNNNYLEVRRIASDK